MPDTLWTIQNIIGGTMAGIMGLLWKDIRSFRKESIGEMDKHKAEVTSSLEKQQAEVSTALAAKLDAEKHSLLCENATYKIREHIDAKLDEVVTQQRNNMMTLKAEIISAINSNGGKGNGR